MDSLYYISNLALLEINRNTRVTLVSEDVKTSPWRSPCLPAVASYCGRRYSHQAWDKKWYKEKHFDFT